MLYPTSYITTEAKLDKNDILVFSLQLGPELTLSDLLGKVLNINQLPQREEKFQVHIRFINIKSLYKRFVNNKIFI